MNSIFSTKEDIIKIYADKRKGIDEEDIEDLFDCLMGYLKQVTSDNETYAVRLGNLGYMYKKFKPEYKKYRNLKPMNKHDLIDDMLVEVCINNNNRQNPLVRESFLQKEYKGMSFEEIQEIQNEY